MQIEIQSMLKNNPSQASTTMHTNTQQMHKCHSENMAIRIKEVNTITNINYVNEIVYIPYNSGQDTFQKNKMHHTKEMRARS